MIKVTLQLNCDSELTVVLCIPPIVSDQVHILLIITCLGKRFVAIQMLINFGVGNLALIKFLMSIQHRCSEGHAF